MLCRNITSCIKELIKLRNLCNKLDKKHMLTSDEVSDFLILYYKYKPVIRTRI